MPGREHDDRDRGPAAQPVHHLDAVDAGQAEIDDRGVVHARGAARQRGLAGLDEIDLVAPRLQVRTQRAQQRTLVVHDQDAPHDARSSVGARLLSGDRSPSSRRHPGVSSTVSSPPTASTKPSRHREPEPDARVARGVAEALERLEHALALRRAGSRNPGRRRAGRHDRPPPRLRRAPGDLGREWRTALSTTFATARSSSAGSTSTSGSVSGTSTTTSCAPVAQARERGRHDLVERRPAGTRARARPTADGSCRAGSRPACGADPPPRRCCA